MAVEHHRKGGDPARIAREAELLGMARHPGVVELIGIEGGPHDPLLVTRRLEGHTLADREPLTGAEAAGVTAALASTLADLHQLGIVHGAVAPEHVLLGPDGRPVLCGFGYGGRAGATWSARPSVPTDFLDPLHGDTDGLDFSIDVYALGALLRFLLPGPSGTPFQLLLHLAEEATGDDVGQRPTAAELAKAINDMVPDARLPKVGDQPVAPRAEALEALRHTQVTGRTRASTNSVKKRRSALLALVATALVAASIFGMNRMGGGGDTAATLPALTLTLCFRRLQRPCRRSRRRRRWPCPSPPCRHRTVPSPTGR